MRTDENKYLFIKKRLSKSGSLFFFLLAFLILGLACGHKATEMSEVEVITPLISATFSPRVFTQTTQIRPGNLRQWIHWTGNLVDRVPGQPDTTGKPFSTDGVANFRFWNYSQQSLSATVILEIDPFSLEPEPVSPETELLVSLNTVEIHRQSALNEGKNQFSVPFPPRCLFVGLNTLTLSCVPTQPLRVRLIRFNQDNASEEEGDSIIKRLVLEETVRFESTGSFEYAMESNRYKDLTFGIRSGPGSDSVTVEREEIPHLTISLFETRSGRRSLYSEDCALSQHPNPVIVMKHLSLEGVQGPIALELAVWTPSGKFPAGVSIDIVKPRITSFADPGRLTLTENSPQRGAERAIAQPVASQIALVIFDAARPDHFGCYGYPSSTTPWVDWFSKQSTLCMRAYAPAPYTLSSVSSLFTGLSPFCHHTIKNTSRLPEVLPTLSEQFSNLGYRTIMLSASEFLNDTFGTSRGFHEHVDFMRDQIDQSLRYPGAPQNWAFPTDSETFAPPLEDWLHRQQNAWKFIYLHLFQPHHPYASRIDFQDHFGPPVTTIDGQTPTMLQLDKAQRKPTESELRQLSGLYDGSLYISDRMFGRTLHDLAAADDVRKTLIIMTSDHGEAFGDHNRYMHNSTTNEEMIHIPLLMKLHGRNDRGVVLERPLSSLDLSHALSDLAAGNDISLRLLANPASHPDFLQPIVSTSTSYHSTSLIEGDWKYICHKLLGEQLFNLSTDPGERHNLAAVEPLRCRLLRTRLDAYQQQQDHCYRSRVKSHEKELTLEQKTVDSLKSLGYIQE